MAVPEAEGVDLAPRCEGLHLARVGWVGASLADEALDDVLIEQVLEGSVGIAIKILDEAARGYAKLPVLAEVGAATAVRAVGIRHAPDAMSARG